MQQYENVVPVVFSVNDGYVPYLGVTIQSLIKYTSANHLYLLNVLSCGISKHHETRLKSLETENVKIQLINVEERMKGRKIPTVRHLTPETTFRLLIDDIFPEYEKIIYLDCDLIVNQDIALLYEEEIENCVLGVSRARLVGPLVKFINDNLKLPIEDYFNAGVLLINIPLFRKYQIGKECLDLLEDETKRYDCMDQDVLNLTCHGKVKYIDGRWNVEWAHLAGGGQEVVIDASREGTLEYVNNPYILHFTSEIKPWSHPENVLSEYFWQVARESVFYEEILQANSNRKKEQTEFSRFLFPWDKVEAGTKVVLYGGGVVGRTFLKQLELTKYCQVLAVCDKQYDKIHDLHTKMIPIEAIGMFDYDYIVIAIEQEKTAEIIKKALIDQQLDSSRIIWKDYRVKTE